MSTALATPNPVRRPACLPPERPWPPVATKPARMHARPVPAPVAPCGGLVRITGTLLGDAQLRHPPGGQGSSTLILVVTTGRGLPYLVRQEVGGTPAEIRAAHAKATTLLRNGARVTVSARGLRIGHTEARDPAAVLLEVLDVIPAQAPAAGAHLEAP